MLLEWLKVWNPCEIHATHLCEIHVNVSMESDEELMRPYHDFCKIGDAIGVDIAWPIILVNLGHLFNLLYICFLTLCPFFPYNSLSHPPLRCSSPQQFRQIIRATSAVALEPVNISCPSFPNKY